MKKKVTINDEVFDFDPSHRPMAEALALENALKMPYAQWEEGLATGSARAMCGLVWLVWRREGRDVPIDDILSGKVEVDLNKFDVERPGDEAGEADPTGPGTGPSSMTAANTSASSPKSSTSAPGRRDGSPRTSSRP